MGILIETAEGPILQIEEATGGALAIEVADSLNSGRAVPTVIIRPERIKDVARFLVAHLAELEAFPTLRLAVAPNHCRYPGEQADCQYPLCHCTVTRESAWIGRAIKSLDERV